MVSRLLRSVVEFLISQINSVLCSAGLSTALLELFGLVVRVRFLLRCSVRQSGVCGQKCNIKLWRIRKQRGKFLESSETLVEVTLWKNL